MDPDLWKDNIIELVGYIADEKFQKNHWFSEGECVLYPNEMYHQLIEDCYFANFLDSDAIQLSEFQKKIGQDLEAKLEDYANKVTDWWNPDIAFNHPLWREVRIAAGKFLEVLRELKT